MHNSYNIPFLEKKLQAPWFTFKFCYHSFNELQFGSANIFPLNTDHTSPLSRSSVIVERSNVLTLLKVLNDLSTVHVDTGRAIAVQIALHTAGNSIASLNMSMKSNWFTWNPLLLHTWYHVFASSTKLSYQHIE